MPAVERSAHSSLHDYEFLMFTNPNQSEQRSYQRKANALQKSSRSVSSLHDSLNNQKDLGENNIRPPEVSDGDTKENRSCI